MAYAFTVSGPVRNGILQTFTIVETDVLPSDEFVFQPPRGGRLVLYTATFDNEDLATEMRPVLGFVTGFQKRVLARATAAAADIRIQGFTNGQSPFIPPDAGALYGCSVVDAHANGITTTLVFSLEGS